MKVTRIIARPWGRKRMGGWIIQRQELLDALKKGQVVEFEKISVGASQLRKLLSLMTHEVCLVKTNGRLEVETIERYYKRTATIRKAHLRRPKHQHQFMAIVPGAWFPEVVNTVVVIKPRKY